MKNIKYVISSAILDNGVVDPIISYASNLNLYAKFVKTYPPHVLWGDVLEATKYDSMLEAQQKVSDMPFKHKIETVEVSE